MCSLRLSTVPEVFWGLLVFGGILFLFLHQHRSVVRVMGGLVQEFSLRFKDFPSCTALVAGGTL